MAQYKVGDRIYRDDYWIDGVCKVCGTLVLGCGSNKHWCDYRFRCANPKCVHFKPVDCGDMEDQEWVDMDKSSLDIEDY
jgi:hypothetical protein